MKIIEKVKDLYKKTFDNEIQKIEVPREYWCDYRDIGRRLEGYKVLVKYRYKGWVDLFFIIDNDHFNLVSKEKALKNAMNFYEKTLFQINRQKTY